MFQSITAILSHKDFFFNKYCMWAVAIAIDPLKFDFNKV